MQKITVSSNEAGQRLDKLLGKYLSNAPMSFVYKMLRKKNIKLNGKKAQGNEKLTKGDLVEVFLSDDTWQKFAGAPGAEKQLPADLARAMKSSIRLSVIYEDPDILILDEPTAVLTPQETDKLFQIMRNMKADGKSLIIITHNAKILEGLQVDYVHVLDDARIVRTGDGSLVNEIIEEGFTALKEDEAK